jgi:hypothetical protein
MIIKARKIHSDRRMNMGKVILGLTVSLDGFVEDSNGSVNPLYADLDLLKEAEVMKESILTTTCIPELCNDNHSKNRCND